MKLAEALQLRADLQRRISQLSGRLHNNARVQEGEQTPEDPDQLLVELEECFDELETLMARINLTNSLTLLPEGSLTELLARRDRMTQQLNILRSFLDAASSPTAVQPVRDPHPQRRGCAEPAEGLRSAQRGAEGPGDRHPGGQLDHGSAGELTKTDGNRGGAGPGSAAEPSAACNGVWRGPYLGFESPHYLYAQHAYKGTGHIASLLPRTGRSGEGGNGEKESTQTHFIWACVAFCWPTYSFSAFPSFRYTVKYIVVKQAEAPRNWLTGSAQNTPSAPRPVMAGMR